jgi:hypothetical protein
MAAEEQGHPALSAALLPTTGMPRGRWAVSSRPLQPSDFGLPNDPARPVLSALSRAFLENFNAFRTTVTEASDLDTQSPRKVNEAVVVRLMENARLHLENAEELSRWIFHSKVLPLEKAFSNAQTFRELGNDWVEAMFSRLQKLPQGAPPRKRQAYINAFEFMLQFKRNSLGLAVRKFCSCGKEHEPKCYQRFKAGIHSLTKTLRKYAPELVARYSVLHPDRAKKIPHG